MRTFPLILRFQTCFHSFAAPPPLENVSIPGRRRGPFLKSANGLELPMDQYRPGKHPPCLLPSAAF
jgi:hypothetical protein